MVGYLTGKNSSLKTPTLYQISCFEIISFERSVCTGLHVSWGGRTEESTWAGSALTQTAQGLRGNRLNKIPTDSNKPFFLMITSKKGDDKRGQVE